MKIVLVDDDPDLIDIMQMALGQAGHEVTASPAGAPIISALKNNPPDVLVTDLMMAELTGLELCEILLADVRLVNTKIILISARTDKLWKEKARDCGASGFIDKPLDPLTFAAKVEEIASA